MRSWFGQGKSLQTAVTACCLNAWVLLGYDQRVFAGILQSTDWQELFNHPSDIHTGIIVSSFDIGCFIGCVATSLLGPPFGRRTCMWLAACSIIVGATLQCSAFSLAHLLVGRIITGVGTGLNSATVPTYQSELCPGHLRGRLVSAELMFVGIGLTISYWLDFGMSYTHGSISWRLPLAMQMIFALVQIVFIFGIPESPRWLFSRDRHAEGVEVLCLAHGKDQDDPLVQKEQRQILEVIQLDGQFKWKRLFMRDEVHTFRRVLLAFGCHFMNQMGGICLVVYYIPSVLVQNVGLTPRLAQLVGGCINMSIVLGSLFPSLFLDKMGRRITMFWGCAGVGLSMLLISILLSIPTKAASSACIAFFFTYMIIFGASINCVPWAYAPEILPLESRTQAIALATSSNWIWNFTVVMITPILINRLGWKAYLIFTVTNFAFIPLFYFFYPETSNKTLEEIDFMFSAGTTGLPFSKRKEVYDSEGGDGYSPEEADRKSVASVHIETLSKERGLTSEER